VISVPDSKIDGANGQQGTDQVPSHMVEGKTQVPTKRLIEEMD